MNNVKRIELRKSAGRDMSFSKIHKSLFCQMKISLYCEELKIIKKTV